MVALSAEFSVNGVDSASIAHSVAYGATVTLALLSTSGANSISWSVDGVSHASMTAPVITAAGSPVGATATFVMPADPGDIQGRAVRIKALITDSANTQSVAYRVIGVPNSYGLIPGTAGEELARHPTMGWTELFNGAMARGVPALVNPTDDGKLPYGSAGAYVLTSTVKVVGAGTALTFGASPAGSGALRFSADSTLNVLLNNGNTVGAVSQITNRFVYGSADAALAGVDIKTGTSTIALHIGATKEFEFDSAAFYLQDNVQIFGTANVATTGLIRTVNNTTIIGSRNAANSGNLSVLAVDASDRAVIGASTRLSVINSTVDMATGTAALDLHNPSGSQTLLRFTFNATVVGGVRPDSAGNFNWYCTTGAYHQFYSFGATMANISASGVRFDASGAGGAASALFDARMRADGVGLRIQAHTTQTNALVACFASDGTTPRFTITGDGSISLRGDLASSISPDASAVAAVGVAVTLSGQTRSGSTAGTHTGGAVTITGGDATGATVTHVGGLLTLRGGDATGASGTRTGGGLDLRAGTGATANGSLWLLNGATARIEINGTGMGFFAAAPIAKPTVTGARGGNAALASALTQLAALGLLTDSSTA